MSMTDPIADMLTRIRNAGGARFDKVDIPASRMKINLARILKEEGFIKNYKVIKDNRQGILRVYLRYAELPKVRGGLGVAVISTSQGVITDRQARKLNVGGEVLCEIW
jgi:small subunit ribosomal protein S8